MKKHLGAAGWGLVLLLSACQAPDRNSVSVTLHFQKAKQTLRELTGFLGSEFEDAFPSSSASYPCYAVNVTGDEIDSTDASDPATAAGIQSILAGNTCTYPGAASEVFSVSGIRRTTLEVPRGENRLFQVVGIQSTVACSSLSRFSTLLTQARTGNPPPSGIGRIVELGRTTSRVVVPIEVQVPNTYSPTSARSIRLCDKRTSLDPRDKVPTPPRVWLRADHFFGTADGANLSTSTWDNEVSSSWLTVLPFGASTATYVANAVSFENPAVQFAGTPVSSVNLSTTVSKITMYVVAKRNASNTGVMACVGASSCTSSGLALVATPTTVDFVKNGTILQSTVSAFGIGEFALYKVSWNSDGSTSWIEAYKSTSPGDSASFTSSGSVSVSKLHIGTGGPQPFNGAIAEVIVYDEFYDDSTNDAVLTYLMNRYGFVS